MYDCIMVILLNACLKPVVNSLGAARGPAAPGDSRTSYGSWVLRSEAEHQVALGKGSFGLMGTAGLFSPDLGEASLPQL